MPQTSTKRVRLHRQRRRDLLRRQNEEFVRLLLERFYKRRHLSAGDWVLAADFFASVDMDSTLKFKNIETSVAWIDEESFPLVRPRYLLDTK